MFQPAIESVDIRVLTLATRPIKCPHNQMSGKMQVVGNVGPVSVTLNNCLRMYITSIYKD